MDWVEIALVSIAAVLAAVEAISLIAGDRPITGAMRTDARRWLIWPWGLGLLSSHFWSPWESPAWGWAVAGVVGVAVVAATFAGRREGVLWPKWAPAAALILGLACGLLWSRGY
jgi:hypothetical protein